MNLEFMSPTIVQASLLVPFKLIDTDDQWEEIEEQLQAMEWYEGFIVTKNINTLLQELAFERDSFGKRETHLLAQIMRLKSK